MALVVAIGGHLGLCVLLLRPARPWRDTGAGGEASFSTLELRLIHDSHPSPPSRWSKAQPPMAKPVSIHAVLLHSAVKAPPVQRIAVPAARPDQRLPADKTLVIQLPDAYSRPLDSGPDGGFRERLRAAERAGVVRGLPGSDTIYAPGIRLTDPMNQGLGAVMRKAQRAFGIENSHCIDVDVWRHLSPTERSARHISPRDVNRVDEKYRCNDPPGLHF